MWMGSPSGIPSSSMQTYLFFILYLLFKPFIALLRDLTIKFETNLKIYMEIARYLSIFYRHHKSIEGINYPLH